MDDDLEQHTGPTVVIDVFRASNTIIGLLAGGARRVLLASRLEQARALRAARPGCLLWGERCGLPPDDFDGGNSPSEAATGAAAGREVVLTTSAGTRALPRLKGAGPLFYGSFANASALAGLLTLMQPDLVVLIPMGLAATEPADEDELCALYLARALAGRAPAYEPLQRRLLACKGADRLRGLGQDDDLAWCTTLDSHPLLPVAAWDEGAGAFCVRPWPGAGG